MNSLTPYKHVHELKSLFLDSVAHIPTSADAKELAFLSLISATLERRVFFRAGFKEVYPNLSIFFVSEFTEGLTDLLSEVKNTMNRVPEKKPVSLNFSKKEFLSQLKSQETVFGMNGLRQKQMHGFFTSQNKSGFGTVGNAFFHEAFSAAIDCEPSYQEKNLYKNLCVNHMSVMSIRDFRLFVRKIDKFLEVSRRSFVFFENAPEITELLVGHSQVRMNEYLRHHLMLTLLKRYSVSGEAVFTDDGAEKLKKLYEFHIKDLHQKKEDLYRKINEFRFVKTIKLATSLAYSRDEPWVSVKDFEWAEDFVKNVSDAAYKKFKSWGF